MARDQTIFSELAVAIAINDGKLNSVLNVDTDSIKAYKRELKKRRLSNGGSDKTNALISAGTLIRTHLVKLGITSPIVAWTGTEKLAAGSSVAKDILITNANLRVSVKENADVYINASPEKIFKMIPAGLFGQSGRGDDWFITTAKDELDSYFLACGGNLIKGCKNASDFYSLIERKQRKVFGKKVKALHEKKDPKVMTAYSTFCKRVSDESAKIFKDLLETSLGHKKLKILPEIFKFFFKLNSVEYILAGVEKNKPFAVKLISFDEWVKKFKLLNMEALPLSKGQPEVSLIFKIYDKIKKIDISFEDRVEIRWSHGKFCGNPEAKVYKTWEYSQLPWVSVV